MNMPRIKEIVEELDRDLPTKDACVLLQQYGGGPDESRVVATRGGLLRLGLAFLKAGVEEKPEKLDIGALIHSDSDINFDSVEIRELFEEEKKNSGRGKIVGVALFGVLLVVLALAAYGLFALVRNITG
jgi:hypothetical protein